MNAALLGARELVGPIIAMTITLAAVYAPIAFQGGLTGSLFREFALTLAGAVFISGIVALLVADDVRQSCCALSTTDMASAVSSTAPSTGSVKFLRRHLDRTLTRVRPSTSFGSA